MGPSGSGKSSLLYILGALEPPTSGTVMLDGRDPFALDARPRWRVSQPEIGFVFQDHCLLPQCSVLENVLVPTLVASRRRGSTARSRRRTRGRSSSRSVCRSDRSPAGGAVRRRKAARRDRARAHPAAAPACSATSRPAISISASADNVAALLLDLHRRHQNILIVVTHSAAARRCVFPIRFELAAGRLVRPGESMVRPGRRSEQGRAPCDPAG